jgi:TPP-dependent pyruvate/acetoin dehydrogenase alpha subunit
LADREKLIEMLRLMYRIRYFEEKLKGLYNYRAYFDKSQIAADQYDVEITGLVGGAVHLYVGQEAVAVGICAALEQEDYVASTHRGHGHAIAKGADTKLMMAELMGRETGYCRGCGGSMHIFSGELGLLGGNGIVGAGMPIALGGAFSAKYRRTTQVSVGFFSEGASNQGTFHESLNMAALWKLPVIYVCENNLYAASTPAEIALARKDVADRAAGYGMPGVIVDGMDVMAVHETACEAVARARAGDGPTLMECKTFRFYGHVGGGEHQNPEQRGQWIGRDPIKLFEGNLVNNGTISAQEQEAMKDEILAEIDEAEEFAKNSPFPHVDVLDNFDG